MSGVEKMENISGETVYFVETEFKRVMPVPESIPNKIFGIEESSDFFVELIGSRTVENFYIVYMNSAYEVIALSQIAKGDIAEVTFSISEALRVALLTNAKYILMAHNHPSGDVTPSKSDIEYTKKIGQAASIFGIQLLDSIIVSADGRSNSIRKNVANNK